MRFIAQEVQPYFPHLVSTMMFHNLDDQIEQLSLSSDFGVLAFAGVKELRLEKDENIASLNNKINQLNAELESLLKRIEELEERK